MRTVIHHGRHSVHRHKGVGSHVEIHFHGEGDGEWSGIYRFGSHGMSVDDFHARVSELKAYHHAKVKRLNGFKELRMRDIIVDGVKHRIIDANLTERGSDVELKISVYIIGALGHQHLAFTMGAKDGLVYPSIEAVPTDVVIEVMVRRRISELALHAAAHEAFVAQLIGVVS